MRVFRRAMAKPIIGPGWVSQELNPSYCVRIIVLSVVITHALLENHFLGRRNLGRPGDVSRLSAQNCDGNNPLLAIGVFGSAQRTTETADHCTDPVAYSTAPSTPT